MMFTCLYLLASISVVAAFDYDDFNVGTTLFTPSDVKKTHWTTTELSLLRTRRHFQAMLPQPSTVTINDKFAKSFLTFVKESYTHVKKASKDPSTEKIMNAALSDTLGGFLKVWVLPVIKFAYYGGTVSHSEATKIFHLYDDIKLCLNTNGTSWKLPSPNLVTFMSINIAPVKASSPRRAKNGCDNIAFFEKTANGLAVPVPKVFWNKNAEYIFIPLKNISIIQLRDAFSNSLLKYYDSAKNCIRTRKRAKEEVEDENIFDRRFQGWLEKDIVPHLNDECLYPALGSVLTLVNKSISLIDAMVEALDTTKINSSQNWFADLHILVSSKKMFLVVIILMLEFMCCIPTICCLFYNRFKNTKKRRRNSKKSPSIYVEYDTYKDLTDVGTTHLGTQYSTSVKSVSIQNSNNEEVSSHSKLGKNYVQSLKNEFGAMDQTSKILARNNIFNKNDYPKICESLKLLVKKDKNEKQDHKKAKSQCAGPTANFGNQTCSKFFDTRNMASINSKNAYYRCSDVFSSEISNNMPSDASLETVQNLEPNKTVTIFKNIYRQIETVTHNKSIQESAECTTTATDAIKDLISKQSKCKTEQIQSQEMLIASTLLDILPGTTIQTSPNNLLIETSPVTKISNKALKGLPKKLGEFPKKFVEIKIDGHRDIAFDIGNGETVEYTYNSRQSKIPKRVNDTSIEQSSIDYQPDKSTKQQCLIPRRNTAVVYNLDLPSSDKKSPRSIGRQLNSTI